MDGLAAIRDLGTIAFVTVGVLFFLAGSVGLIRFPDLFTRLHAVTKADNVGLGFIVAGLAFGAESLGAGIELAAVWVLVLAGSSTVGHLIARHTHAWIRSDPPRARGDDAP